MDLLDLINTTKVTLYAKIDANWRLVGGQVSHSLTATFDGIDASSKSTGDNRVYLEKEGALTAEVSGEILFSDGEGYQFLRSNAGTGRFIDIKVRRGNEDLSNSKTLKVLITAISEANPQAEALKSSFTMTSTGQVHLLPPPVVIGGVLESQFISTTRDNIGYGVARDVTGYWVTGGAGNIVYHLTSTGTFLNDGADTIDVSPHTLEPAGIVIVADKIYVLGNDTNKIHIYDTLSRSHTGDIDLSGQGNAPQDIGHNGTHLMVTFANSTSAFFYDVATGYTGQNFDIASADAAITSVTGVAHDGVHYWAVSITTNKIYQFNDSFAFTGFNFVLDEAGPLGLDADGKKLYVYGASAGSVLVYA